MSFSSLHRIQNEVKLLQDNTEITGDGEEKLYQVSMVNDSFYHWHVLIFGPKKSHYRRFAFKLELTIPPNYPMSPPKIKFLTPILHLNVNTTGDICLDLLKDSWNSSHNLRLIIMAVRQLLSEPNGEDPLNYDLGQTYRTNPKLYKKEIRKHCLRNAINNF